MSITYAVRKCYGIGYAKNMEAVREDEERKTLTIGDHATYKTLEEFASATIDRSEKVKIVIELGYIAKGKITREKSLTEEEFWDVVKEININDPHLEDYKKGLMRIKTAPDDVFRHEYTPDFLHFLTVAYPKIHDHNVQVNILTLLRNNRIPTNDLQRENPPTFEEVEADIVKRTAAFADVPVKDPMVKNPEDEDDAILIRNMKGDMTEFNGLGNSYALIDNAKMSANIANDIPIRNHGCIDILARNMIVTTPETRDGRRLNTLRLIDELTRFSNFVVVFVWPNLRVDSIFASEPSEAIEVAHGEGNVILNVFLYHILKSFYGMHLCQSEVLAEKYMM